MSHTDAEHTHTAEEERDIREAALDETISSSFPASDPPSTLPNPDEHDASSSPDKEPEAVKPQSRTSGGAS
jgi:hypothetical protein